MLSRGVCSLQLCFFLLGEVCSNHPGASHFFGRRLPTCAGSPSLCQCEKGWRQEAVSTIPVTQACAASHAVWGRCEYSGGASFALRCATVALFWTEIAHMCRVPPSLSVLKRVETRGSEHNTCETYVSPFPRCVGHMRVLRLSFYCT